MPIDRAMQPREQYFLGGIGKAIKKVVKSPIGKVAALAGLGYFGPKLFGAKTGFGNWGKALTNFKNLDTWKQAALVGGGLGLAGGIAATPEEEDEGEEERRRHTTEVNKWLKRYYSYYPELGEPIYNVAQGGLMNDRVKYNIGGLEIMGMTPQTTAQGPGIGQGIMNARMNPTSMMNTQSTSMMQPTGRATSAMNQLPKKQIQNEDSELMQLIQMLMAMGFPIDELRGRTKEELVEILATSTAKGEEVEEETVRETAAFGAQPWMSPLQEQASFPPDQASIALNQGGRVGLYAGANQGLPGIPVQAEDGIEFDMRESGGFQPLGAQEKKDDVKALLAKNEFVMTSDAVKGLGEGDTRRGAKRMYDLMNQWEAMA